MFDASSRCIFAIASPGLMPIQFLYKGNRPVFLSLNWVIAKKIPPAEECVRGGINFNSD
jgi:hypothetical protein